MMKTTVYVFILVFSCHCCQATKVYLKQVRPVDFFGYFWEAGGGCGAPWIKSTEAGTTRKFWSITNSYKKPPPGYYNCYLLSDYYKLPSTKINLAFIKIRGGGTNCTYVVKNFGYLCDQNYTLRTYSGPEKGDTTRKGIDLSLYKNVSVVPNITKPLSLKFYTYNGTYSVAVSGKTALRLMFHAKYYMGNIDDVSLYYYNCPVNSEELVQFPLVNAPSKAKSPLRVDGQCSSNSVPKSKEMYMKCYYDGKFTIHGGCECDVGYEFESRRCKECKGDTFKPNVGNAEKCRSCGKNTLVVDKRRCNCKEKYYRAIGKETQDEADCYRPPSAPSVKEIRNREKNSATIEFRQFSSSEIGDGSAVTIILNCSTKSCPPRSMTITQVSDRVFNVTGLRSFTEYFLVATSTNNVTRLTGKRNSLEFNFTTKEGGRPGVITGFKDTPNSDGSVTLSWNRPIYGGGQGLKYLIEYGSESQRTKEESIRIPSGTATVSYRFKITAFYVDEDGREIFGKESFLSAAIKIKGGGIGVIMMVIIAIVVMLVVVIISIISFCVYKKRNPPLMERGEDGRVIQTRRLLPGAPVYVDPTIYKAVDEAVEEFAYELNRSHLTFGKLIGGGEFAEVYTGSLMKDIGKTTNVAIKTLKSGASKKDRDDFLSEAAILGQFIDPNVIAIEGVVMKDRPNLIVLEFMANGSLDTYLQKNDMQFQVVELLNMARCVASGMTYLSDMGFIHRDLAARNILVDEHNICKISDFGMSRVLKLDDHGNDTYETQGGKIPVRWTAPEAIQFKKFTSASDCWSYGILLWEIMSYGERPYWDWGNYTVLERLNDGYRLPPPMSCPKVIHNLMLDCWNKDRAKRPKFKEIREKIEQWIRSPELLEEIASVVTKTDENLDYTVLETVQVWLEAVKLPQYTQLLIDSGYTTPKQMLDLDDNKLINIGIDALGHRKKICKAIANTRKQVDARHFGTPMNGSMRKKTFSLSRSLSKK